jgi:hypothetical protein
MPASRFRKRLLAVTVALLSVVALLGALVVWKNWPTGFDGEELLATQPAKAEGRVGIVVAALAQPGTYEPTFYVTFIDKLLKQAIPWPINVIAGRDRGVALADPGRAFAPEAFTPTRLLDAEGRDRDRDGTPWMTRWQRGEIAFDPPSENSAEDTGIFLYEGRDGGLPTITGKILVKMRYLYYGRLPNGYLPHYDHTLGMANGAIARVRARHPEVVAAEVGEVFHPARLKASVEKVLDAGVDTLVLSSALPILSDFEEMRGSYPKIVAIAENWAARTGRPMPRLMIAPQLADSPEFEAAWLDHLSRTAPPPPRPGASVNYIVTMHGLPVSTIDKDRWKGAKQDVVARMLKGGTAQLRAMGYGRITAVEATEAFGDDLEDPDNRLYSVSEAFRDAAKRGDDVAIALPIEFLAENTDTLFGHAAVMFKDLPGYTPFAAPPKGTDWSKPYVREFRLGKTRLMYVGTLGGAQQSGASDALATAIAKVLP